MSAAKAGKPLSLKMRAIALLAQRDQSVVEMRRKLLRIASQNAIGEAGEAKPGPDAQHEVEALLNWLQAEGYLCERRFVESRIQARAQRYGMLRIRQELAEHGLSLDADAQAELKLSEFERARAVWSRKFGPEAPQQAADRAKQTRFLAARGFGADVIRRVLRGLDE